MEGVHSEMEIELIRLRVGKVKDDPTIGTLRGDGGRLLGIYTLEEPWLENEPNISCIPEGSYVAKRRFDVELGTKAKRGEDLHPLETTFEVSGVPGRSGILFHPGNTTLDTRGCILPGFSVGPWKSLYMNFDFAVLDSRRAFRTFLEWTDDVDRFNFLVKSV